MSPCVILFILNISCLHDWPVETIFIQETQSSEIMIIREIELLYVFSGDIWVFILIRCFYVVPKTRQENKHTPTSPHINKRKVWL